MQKEHIHKLEILKVNNTAVVNQEDLVAIEEPMEIRLTYGPLSKRERSSLSVTMRTPGDDFELAAGFLFSEGIIHNQSDILKIEHCPNEDQSALQNVVRVELHPSLSFDLKQLDRNFYTNSACGLCGKTSIEAVLNVETVSIDKNSFKISIAEIYSLIQKSREQQLTFDHTGGLHAAALFSKEGELQIIREDIGRHNALDKVMGAAFFSGASFPLKDNILLLSGRAGFELIQKAMVAGIPLVAAVGAPSSLAIELAKESNMTLIGFLRKERFNVYCGEERIG
jgi:FdhD protein